MYAVVTFMRPTLLEYSPLCHKILAVNLVTVYNVCIDMFLVAINHIEIEIVLKIRLFKGKEFIVKLNKDDTFKAERRRHYIANKSFIFVILALLTLGRGI